MPASYTITFLPEGRVERFYGSRGNYYEFADGSHLDIYVEPVWCSRCRRVTNGEAIPTVESLDKQLAELGGSGAMLAQLVLPPGISAPDFEEKFRRERIEEASRRRAWRLSRRSPPKCIHCGATEIVALPNGQPVTVATRSMPITIVIRVMGLCSTTFNEWFFTPEGDRIPRDTKPTYWQMPGVDAEESRRQVRQFLETRGKRQDQRNANDEKQ